jgi:ParB family chromosome partitioning protein
METTPTVVPIESPALLSLPLGEIKPSPLNPRKLRDEKTLKDLAASIAEKGVIEPILVRPKAEPTNDTRYEIVCGERRFLASQIAGKAEIPAILHEMDDRQVLETQVIENLQRADIHELDEAEGYRRLIEMNHGYTPEVISEKVSKAKAYVYGRLQLLKLADALKALFYKGQMNVSVASRIARLQEKDQVACAKHFGRDEDGIFRASIRDVDHWIESNVLLNLDSASFKKDDATLYPEAGPCTACPKRTGASPLLFPDLQRKRSNTCTDPRCFEEKVHRFIELRAAELGATLKVVYGYVDYRAAENLRRQGIGHISKYGGDDFVLSKKDACASTKLALVVAGDEAPAGSTVYVCGDNGCKLHRPRHQEDPQARAKRLAEEAKARHEVNKRRAIYNALVEASKKESKLDASDYRLICLKFFERMYFEDSRQFVRVLGFIGPSEAKKLKVKPTDERDDGSAHAKFFRACVEKAEPRHLHSLLLEMALFFNRDRAPYSYQDDKHDPLLDAAKRWDIDVKGITSQMDRAFAQAQLKKAEAEKRRREKEKAEAKKPTEPSGAEADKARSRKSKGAKSAKAKSK